MKNLSKILLLIMIYFLPFLIAGMAIDLSYGLWWSLALLGGFVFFTYTLAPIMILGSLSATKKEDRRFTDLIEEVHQVAFALRINAPRLYYTRVGTPSIWGFGLNENSTYLIIHQEFLELLDADERMSVITYQLLRMKRKKLNFETFVIALGLWFYFPLQLCFRKKTSVLAGAFFLASSVALFLNEMLQSIIFNDRDIFDYDQKTVQVLETDSSFISALTKLDCHETQLGFNERFLLIISVLNPTAHKDFLNFFINFPASQRRIDLLQGGQSS